MVVGERQERLQLRNESVGGGGREWRYDECAVSPKWTEVQQRGVNQFKTHASVKRIIYKV